MSKYGSFILLQPNFMGCGQLATSFASLVVQVKNHKPTLIANELTPSDIDWLFIRQNCFVISVALVVNRGLCWLVTSIASVSPSPSLNLGRHVKHS